MRPSGPRDRGRIFGNLLGLLVVVISAGLLAFAVILVLQNAGHAAPLPPPPSTSFPPATGAAPTIATAGPGSSASASSTPAPVTSPTGGAITPAPTAFVPEVQVGPGYVTFGTNADQTLRVTDPKTTFSLDEEMVWSAYLTQPVDSASVRVRILRLDAESPTGQTLVREDEVKPVTRSGQIFLRRLRPLGTTIGAGLYTIQYVRGDEILAEGSFVILP